MEVGRVKETIKKRAILKKIKKVHSKDSSFNIFAVSDTVSAPVWLLKEGRKDYIKVQIESIFNQFYIESVKPISAMMTAVIILPEQTEESCLHFLMDCITEKAEEWQIEISDVKAECSRDVRNAIIFFTVFEKRENLSFITNDSIIENFIKETFLPDRELVMMGAAALEGTIMLESAGRKQLEQRFSNSFLNNVRKLLLKIEIKNKIELVQEKDMGLYYIGRTGIFGALWEIASFTGKGFFVNLKDIPIFQETIELCEFFDVNPYMLRSGGALLVAAKQGRILVDRCKACGIEAAVIGAMQDNADKIVYNGEESRYLTMPAAVKLGQNQPEGIDFIY